MCSQRNEIVQQQEVMPMKWLIILIAVLLVSLIAVLYAVAHAMDYDPAWDEEEDHDYTGRT
jgi:hypothetical protein